MNRAVLLLGVVLACIGGKSTWGVPTAYDGFDYANDGTPLAGQSGGYGWNGPWTELGAGEGNEFTLSQSETSLDLPTLPFDPIGDHVIAAGPGSGGNNNVIRRPLTNSFDLGSDGVLYASYLMSKTGSPSGGSNNQELNLLSGGSQTIRLGSTSGNRFWLGTSSNNFEDITLDSTYFVVLRVDASAASDDILSMVAYDSSESIPASDPGSYDATHTFSSGAVLNGAQFWIGTNASGMYDELRIGSTWADVTSVDPDFALGDFDLVGGITPADFQILSENLFIGTTYEEGDIDFSGLVDLTDFAIFREIYGAAGFTAGNLSIVPEPNSCLLLLAATSVAAVRLRRQRPAKRFMTLV